jgi:hypothetical protein
MLDLSLVDLQVQWAEPASRAAAGAGGRWSL